MNKVNKNVKSILLLVQLVSFAMVCLLSDIIFDAFLRKSNILYLCGQLAVFILVLCSVFSMLVILDVKRYILTTVILSLVLELLTIVPCIHVYKGLYLSDSPVPELTSGMTYSTAVLVCSVFLGISVRNSRQRKTLSKIVTAVGFVMLFVFSYICIDSCFFPGGMKCNSSWTVLIKNIYAYHMKAGSNAYYENWSRDVDYTRDYAVNLQKNKNEDFVILNLTDIQLRDYECDGPKGKITWDMIDELIQNNDPDLITLTGDNAWGTYAYQQLVHKLDAYGIPWAPIMGNHDGQGMENEYQAVCMLSKASNCLFKVGPIEMGHGNYIVNIEQNGEVIHSLIMMDSHNEVVVSDKDNETVIVFDGLWKKQIDWYQWAIEGIESIRGSHVESSVFLHIPIMEYKQICDSAYDRTKGVINEGWSDTGFGQLSEDVCATGVHNDFLSVCKEVGSTKNFFFGHDHMNSLSVEHDGIRYTYCLKSGLGSTFAVDNVGCSILTIDDNGNLTVDHEYSDLEKYGIE